LQNIINNSINKNKYIIFIFQEYVELLESYINY